MDLFTVYIYLYVFHKKLLTAFDSNKNSLKVRLYR